MRHITLILAAFALAIAAPAIADKGGNGNGNGGGSGSDGGASSQKPSSYSPTLSISWPETLSVSSTDATYVIEGCDYDPSYGMVTVVVYTPVSAGWTGRMPDGGCISVSNFQTQGAGTYRVEAWQHVKNRDVVVASTSFTL